MTGENITFSVEGTQTTGKVVLQNASNVDSADDGVAIRLEDEITLTFALRYLSNFTKATSLSQNVTLSLSADVPLAVEYSIEEGKSKKGYVRFFLAPKIDD